MCSVPLHVVSLMYQFCWCWQCSVYQGRFHKLGISAFEVLKNISNILGKGIIHSNGVFLVDPKGGCQKCFHDHICMFGVISFTGKESRFLLSRNCRIFQFSWKIISLVYFLGLLTTNYLLLSVVYPQYYSFTYRHKERWFPVFHWHISSHWSKTSWVGDIFYVPFPSLSMWVI